MSIHYYEIIKRDGTAARFDVIKIVNAIQKAAAETTTEIDYEKIRAITNAIEKEIQHRSLTVEEVQDMVEVGLMKEFPQVAKAYILYRDNRNKQREAGLIK